MGSMTPEQLRRIWPQATPHCALLRELAALLLEDPDNRMRVKHAEALLHLRMGPGAPSVPLTAALSEPSAVLALEPGPDGDGNGTIVRLDAAALAAALSADATKRAAAAAAAATAVSDDASEEERLQAAVELAWPDAEDDGGDYLARAIAGALLQHQDAKGQLPRHSLHMTDIGSHLRSAAAADVRLAAIFPRNRDQASVLGAPAAAPGSAAARCVSNGSSTCSKDAKLKPRISEFVSQPRCSAYFGMGDSQARKGEKVLVLKTGALLECLAEQQAAAREAQQERQPDSCSLGAEQDAPVAAPQGPGRGAGGLLASAPLDAAAPPLWAPLGLAATPCSGAPARRWGAAPAAAAPITPDCSALGVLPHRAAMSAFGPAPAGGRAPLASDSVDGGGRCLFGDQQQQQQQQQQQAGLYRSSSLFGSGDVGEAAGLGTPGLGGRGDMEPITPAAFGAARWGSGVAPGGAAGPLSGGPLPALQPLVGSFSLGTGLGLGTLLRGFGTDADGGGVAAGDGAGGTPCFSGGVGGSSGMGSLGDSHLFGASPGHAAWVSGLQLGSTPLDLVPRSIANVWGAPAPLEAAPASNQRILARPEGDPFAAANAAAICSDDEPPRLGQQQQRDGQQVAAAPPPLPQQHVQGQSGQAGSAAFGASAAVQPVEGEEHDGEDAVAMSNSGSSGALLSLRGVGTALAAAADSSVPDSEGSSSPVSAVGSEAQPDSGSGGGGHVDLMAAVAATMAVCREEDEDPGGSGLEQQLRQGTRGNDAQSAAQLSGSADVGAGESGVVADSAEDGSEEQEEAGGNPPAAEAGVEPDGGSGSSAPRLTGWALVAAKTPPKPLKGPGSQQASVPRSAPAPKDAAATAAPLGGASALAAAALARRGDASRSALSRLHPGVRDEVERLIASLGGVVRAEDFDEGVVHQLNTKRTWEEAAEAVRHLSSYDLAPIQHPAAYINHIIKHFTPGAAGGAGSVGTGSGGASSGQIRLASVPISTKAMLHKCGVRVYQRVEEAVASSSQLQWHHFDAGVVKVLAELAKLSEEDVFEELEALKRSDLKSLQHVPAYLNKRLNNRLWQRRKMRGD